MVRFEEGDRVRIDIPRETDPDFEWHGSHGQVSRVLEDDASEITGVPEDGVLYRVQVGDGVSIDVRGRDVRPPLE